MTRRPSTRRALLAAAAGAGLALAAACTSTDVPESLPGPTTATTEAAAPPALPPAGCDPDSVTESLAPPEGFSNDSGGPTVDAIRARGRLRVGVDTSTLLFSSVNPRTGDFEGFDIDIAEQVAIALFGPGPAPAPGEPPAPREGTIEFVAIPYSERVDVLDPESGEPLVDMVVDTFTINCEREERIDFSTEYFTSTQKLLVPTTSGIASIDDMTPDQRVCAPAGSTSLQNLQALQAEEDGPEPVPVPDNADCLVLIQQGEVDGISTDDTILAGMVAQDPNLEVVGEPFADEPYGIGVPAGQEDWLGYVNGVLDQLRADDTWMTIYNVWLREPLGSEDAPPPARYPS